MQQTLRSNPVQSTVSSRRICVVIPAYNAADTIGPVIAGALKYVDRVLVADDASSDETARIAADAGARVFPLAANRGKGNALKILFMKAAEEGFSAAVTMDADGQHDPEDLPLFIEAHRQHPQDLLLGSRMHAKDKIPRHRYNSMHIARFFVSLAANQYVEDTQCGFRLYPLELILRLELTTERYVTETEVLIKTGDSGGRIRPVPVEVIYGKNKSYFRPLRDIDAITAYVMSYLLIKWSIEMVRPGRRFTYRPDHLRDVIGRRKFIEGRFLTFSMLVIFPATFGFWLGYALLGRMGKNNFASVRAQGIGFALIVKATHLLPVLLVIAIMDKAAKMAGCAPTFLDRFIKRYYPHIWSDHS